MKIKGREKGATECNGGRRGVDENVDVVIETIWEEKESGERREKRRRVI